MEIGIDAKCWMISSEDKNKGTWNTMCKRILVPTIPRLGETVRLSFEEDHRQRDVEIKEIRYTEGVSPEKEFDVVIHGVEKMKKTPPIRDLTNLPNMG